MSVLTFDRVSHTYTGAAEPSLLDVSLSVGEGELVVVAGLSGSGKSTLLRAASGLVPHFHGGEFGGRVIVEGLDTREHGPADISAVCGSLFQDPETQIVMGTVRAELALPLENRGLAPGQVAREVEEISLALGIAGLLDRPTGELSGGETQRVVLGAALAGRPPLIVLDEPTSQLDPVAGDELIWLIRRLNEEWGTSVLLAEHRLERCLAAADRVLAMVGGRVACDDSPRGFQEWAAEASPALQTPGARLFARAGLRPPPAGVKDARATLRSHGLLPERAGVHARAAGASRPAPGPGSLSRRERRSERHNAAVSVRGVWHEFGNGIAALRDVSLEVAPGERIALMGRNGAGKSTLLRHVKGLMKPTRGRIDRAGEVALLLQNPNDYLLRDRVGEEAGPEALERAGLGDLADRHPRDLSGGERQRLALAIVAYGPTAGGASPAAGGASPTAADAAGGALPAAVCLDEPTRGMDRGHRGALTSMLRELSARGCAVLVATHDPELAADFADRVVLLGDGGAIADGPTGELLSGGWYFATETARILGGAAGALRPEEGAEELRRRLVTEVAP